MLPPNLHTDACCHLGISTCRVWGGVRWIHLGLGLIFSISWPKENHKRISGTSMKPRHNLFMEFPKVSSTATPVLGHYFCPQSTNNMCLSHLQMPYSGYNQTQRAIDSSFQISNLPNFLPFQYFSAFVNTCPYDQIFKIFHYLWHNLLEFGNFTLQR